MLNAMKQRNLTVEPIVESHIRKDITERVTFNLKHKFQVSQVERRRKGLQDSRSKLYYLLNI